MSLRRRLERLEGGGGRCPECGIGPDSPIEYVVDWGGGDAPEPLPPCATCGQAEIVVDWDDAPTPEEHARMEARMFDHARQHPEVHYLRPPVPDYPPWPGGDEEGGG